MVYSYTVVHYAANAALAGSLPCTVVLVSLEPDWLWRQIDGDHVIVEHFSTVAQQRRGIQDHAPDIETRQRDPLRTGVGEEGLDGLVQAFGLAQHDVHQLRLLIAERQLLPQDLQRP